MVFALGAGKLFRLDHQGEFEETIVGMCLEQSHLLLTQLTTNSQVHRHVRRSLGPPEPTCSLEFRTLSFSHRIISRQRQRKRYDPLFAIFRSAKVPPISRNRRCSDRRRSRRRLWLTPFSQLAFARHTKEPSWCHPAHLRVMLQVWRIPPRCRHCHRGTQPSSLEGCHSALWQGQAKHRRADGVRARNLHERGTRAWFKRRDSAAHS
jgi:hypothetical protein